MFCGVLFAPNGLPKPFGAPFMFPFVLAGPPAGPDVGPVEKKFDPPNDEPFVFGNPFIPPAPFGENIGDIPGVLNVPMVPIPNMDARNGLGVPVNWG